MYNMWLYDELFFSDFPEFYLREQNFGERSYSSSYDDLFILMTRLETYRLIRFLYVASEWNKKLTYVTRNDKSHADSSRALP